MVWTKTQGRLVWKNSEMNRVLEIYWNKPKTKVLVALADKIGRKWRLTKFIGKFKTKKQALKFARSWMSKHPRG